jgi:hypothetical protein
VYHPPQRILIPLGTGEPRTNAGAIDLGAYELIALPHVGGTAAGPRRLRLEQNYPNPFNPRTTIVYNVGSRASIELKVFDVLGREVATLVKDDAPPGEHTVTWDATGMPGGVYYYRLVAGTSLVTRAMVVLR